MATIRRADVQVDESMPNLSRWTMLNAAAGAGHLEVGVLTIAPGSEIALHIHPTHEEGMYIVDGPMDYVLGDEKGTVDTGDMLLAPARVPHSLSNSSSEPKSLLFIFPTTNVQRVYL